MSYWGAEHDLAQVVLEAMAITGPGFCSESGGRWSVARFRWPWALGLSGHGGGSILTVCAGVGLSGLREKNRIEVWVTIIMGHLP
ncbi:MAG: hypothetical protein RMI91_02025 [Gemmatales bacterium]|nr:hypothetical protein [Gemmatales bacterium]MDW7993404.1 hypothetical protein [Gemmatales bacterium]